MIYRCTNRIIFILTFILSSCSLFNAGTVHLKYSDGEAFIEGNKYELKKRLGNISASVRHVEHPKQHSRWDIGLKLTPSIHLDRFTFQTGKLDENQVQMPDLKYRRLSGLANLKLGTQTPIGQFVLTAGFGAGVFKLNDGAGIDTIRTGEVRKLDLAYVVFPAKRFFLLMGPRYYNSDFEQYTFAFRIGYFWGDI
jgi:hypothetical protein